MPARPPRPKRTGKKSSTPGGSTSRARPARRRSSALGNDPFERGAAVRAPEAGADEVGALAPEPAVAPAEQPAPAPIIERVVGRAPRAGSAKSRPGEAAKGRTTRAPREQSPGRRAATAAEGGSTGAVSRVRAMETVAPAPPEAAPPPPPMPSREEPPAEDATSAPHAPPYGGALDALAAALRSGLSGVEARIDALADLASARLAELGQPDALAEQAAELRRTLARLWPALRERLCALDALRVLLTGPGEVDAFGLDRALEARLAPVIDFLYAQWWRVEARGLDSLPAEGPLMVVANHGGVLPWDALVLRAALSRRPALPRELRPLLDPHALSAPVSGRLAARLGAVAATPENAVRLLEAGGALAVFPEGSRNGARAWSARYRIDCFGRGGFARLALRTGASVIPCAIVGSEETSAPFARAGWLADRLGLSTAGSVLPVLELVLSLLGGANPLSLVELFPLPSRWTLHFGEPVSAGVAAGTPSPSEERVQALAERTRESLQRLLSDDVAARRSVYL